MRGIPASVIFAACALAVGACDDSPETSVVVDPSQVLAPEAEPNGTTATATPIVGTNVVLQGDLFRAADTDLYSFVAAAGDRVYVATQSQFSPSGSNVRLSVLASDGITVLETDDENGAFGGDAAIAGTVLATAGTYYVRAVSGSATATVRPYQLNFQLRSGAPTPEGDDTANDTVPELLPASAWISGSLSALTDIDLYSIALNAGDSVYATLDLDPERDGLAQANGTLAIVVDGRTLTVDDSGAEAGADAEAIFLTVKAAGIYTVRVGATAGASTYHLGVSVRPAEPTCTTYSTAIPVLVTDASGPVTSTINVPDDVVIGDVDITLQGSHTCMQDLDVHLIAPAGNDVGVMTDAGSCPGAPVPDLFDLTLDDEATIPVNLLGAGNPPFVLNPLGVPNGVIAQPRSVHRLSWLDGQSSSGDWTLQLWDDFVGDEGTLTGWSITICAAPPPPACAPGSVATTLYSNDFEVDDGGFTHAGAADEWTRGMPTAAPITTCGSGVSCWKTDLAGTYNASSAQELLSPVVSLANVVGGARVRWSQKYQMESASFDHALVQVRNADDSGARTVWEFKDGSMAQFVGVDNLLRVDESAGWGIHTADISSFAGGSVELRFLVDSDSSGQFAGLAIDDVAVIGCVSDGSCGNGSPDPGEVCDDGNTDDGDGCNATCTSLEVCGNSIVDVDEACDFGDTEPGNGCSADCTSDLTCGNGIEDPAEICDDGDDVEGDGCDSNCTVSACGNDIQDPSEACDLGDTDPGNGCNADCSSDLTCGNDVVDPGELCDDGNNTAGDGCGPACNSDETCGNDVVDIGEACDLGDTDPGNGCNATCTSNLTCGNNVTDPGELCDDGNTAAGDGCGPACNSNETCGNSMVDVDEACDDGDTTAGDGCNATCTSDETCGNDFVDPGEACDDGNTGNGDGCESTCELTGALVCGNGVVDVGEVCDDGNTVDGDGCGYNCRSDESCGNGFVDEDTEACDDGRTEAGDGCSATCTLEVDAFCGDGTVDPTEECDDDNVLAGDGCSSECEVELEPQTGCGCSTSGPGATGNALLVLLGLVGLVGRRRRSRG